jgi:hypothetical protein
MSVAEQTIEVFRLFKQMDRIKAGKDYLLYFQMALVNLHLLNDKAAFDVHISKMKSLIEISMVLRANMHLASPAALADPSDLESSCFLVVDASSQSFGKILFANKTIKAFLGYS